MYKLADLYLYVKPTPKAKSGTFKKRNLRKWNVDIAHQKQEQRLERTANK